MLERIRNMKQGAGSGQYNGNTFFLQVSNRSQRFFVMISPDIFAVYKSRKQYLILWKSKLFDQLAGLSALNKIQSDRCKRHPDQICINISHIAKISL